MLPETPARPPLHQTTKETVAPALTISAPMYVNSSTARGVTVSGTTEAGTVVNVTVRDSVLNCVPKQATVSGTSWSTTLDLSSLKDGTLTYTAATTDAAGNSTTATAAGATGKDTLAPTVTGITLANGGPKPGTADKGDTVTIQFSEALAPGTFCSSSSSATVFNGTATLSNAGTNDTLSFSTSDCTGLSIGTISMGGDYVTATATFGPNANGSGGSSTFTWDSTDQTRKFCHRSRHVRR
jgi:hypothetical protein